MPPIEARVLLSNPWRGGSLGRIADRLEMARLITEPTAALGSYTRNPPLFRAWTVLADTLNILEGRAPDRRISRFTSS